MKTSEMYKKCFIPKCKSTKCNNPQKIFYTVPIQDKERRKSWFLAADRQDYSSNTDLFCCSDHFDVSL